MTSAASLSTTGAPPLGGTGPTWAEKAAERAQAKLRDARSALEMLKQNRTGSVQDAAEQRKARAKQKIEQLKARLRMMQMSGSVDPKVLAQVARELKAAVQAFAAAGGSAAGLGAAGAGAAPVAGTGGAETTAGVSSTPAAEGQPPTTQVVVAEAEDAKNDNGQAKADPAIDPYRRMAEENQARIADAGRRSAADQADRETLTDARNLAALIKSLARRAAQKAEADPAAREDARQAEASATDAARAVEDAASAVGSAGLFLTV